MNEFFDLFFFGALFSGKDKNKKALFDKKWTALNTFYNLLSIVMNRFLYKLPETMDKRFLELCLLTHNQAGIAKVDGKVKNFSVISTGARSSYGYPTNYSLCDFMGKSVGRFIPNTPDAIGADSVLMFNDEYNIAPISRIIWYANRMTELQTSISAAIANLKGSTVVRCSKEQKSAVEKAWRMAQNGVPIIICFDDNTGALQQPPEVITNPQTPEILISLQENYDKTIAQFCAEFGINSNIVVNKLSGISDNELAQNNQLIEIKLNTEFNQRKKGLQQINEMFGTDATIELNYNVVALDAKAADATGGAADDRIKDDDKGGVINDI